MRTLRKYFTVFLSSSLLLFTAGVGSNPGTDLSAAQQLPGVTVHRSDTLQVMSLNLAHGRKDSINQFLVSEEQTRQNLRDIAEVVQANDIDVLALQEADAPSRWSGGFNHVTELSMQSAYPVTLHSLHARNWIYKFGTALISRVAFVENLQHDFAPSPPTTNKGFSLGQIAWQYGSKKEDTLAIDLVSVHLDFSRQSVREGQISELISILEQRDQPRVIMGDFNTDWHDDDGLIRELTERLGLRAYSPESVVLGTYPSSGRRLDWILASRELAFVSYENLPDELSDHLAVVATLKIDQTVAELGSVLE